MLESLPKRAIALLLVFVLMNAFLAKSTYSDTKPPSRKDRQPAVSDSLKSDSTKILLLPVYPSRTDFSAADSSMKQTSQETRFYERPVLWGVALGLTALVIFLVTHGKVKSGTKELPYFPDPPKR